MGQYEEAVPILKRLEITATFFVVGCLLEGTFPPVMALQHLIQEIGVAQTEFLITERLPSEYRDYFDMQFSSVHEVLKATEPQDVRPLKAVMNHLVPPPHAMSALQSILETTTNQREIVEKRFMGKLQVKKLSGMGMEIGAHTQNHLPFVMVDLDKIKPGEEYNMHTLPLITTKLEEIDQEVAGGFDILQNMGLPVTSFAYPFGGRFPMEVQGIVAHHATSGWNYFTGRGSISQEEVFKNLFNIPRLDVDLYRNLGWLS